MFSKLQILQSKELIRKPDYSESTKETIDSTKLSWAQNSVYKSRYNSSRRTDRVPARLVQLIKNSGKVASNFAVLVVTKVVAIVHPGLVCPRQEDSLAIFVKMRPFH